MPFHNNPTRPDCDADGDTSPAELDHLTPQGFQRGEVEFLRAVVTPVGSGTETRLQPIGACDGIRLNLDDDQMIANGIERVPIQTGRKGLRQTF